MQSNIRRRGRRAVPRRALVAALTALTPAAGRAQGVDPEQAGAYFAEAEALGAADASTLWGVALHGPMLFVDRGTRSLVANVPDSAGLLQEEGGLYVGRLPEGIGVYNGALEWAGRRWTMLAWPLPYGRYERQRLMAHELFHRVQPALGLPADNPANDHLDAREARTWLRLEWRALQEALAQSGARRREAVMDALGFRAERRRLHPEAAESERLLELNEGLAEYTGVRVGIPAAARAGWVVRQLETVDVRSRHESVVRSFAYPSGAAYGLLLDGVDPQWARRVTPATDLGALLAAAYDVAAAAPDTSGLQARAERYAGSRLNAEELTREQARLAQQAQFRARFVTGPTLTLPTSQSLQYSFDPNAVVPFDGGGTVYLTFEVTDVWGTLRVTDGGALLRTGESGAVVVPAPTSEADSVLRGAGWELTLADGWQAGPGARAGDRVVARRP
ncbi:MAG TPA: hypothetical protein VK939_10760 [Longimicrobiales bacterium]|nr:hypothetical protein [Longimicrobiales bacterium]